MFYKYRYIKQVHVAPNDTPYFVKHNYVYCPQRDCPDGQLSRQQFRDIYKELFPGGDPQAFCDHVFRSFDLDCNGTLEFAVCFLLFDFG